MNDYLFTFPRLAEYTPHTVLSADAWQAATEATEHVVSCVGYIARARGAGGQPHDREERLNLPVEAAEDAERFEQARLLRDIIGNPFHHPPSLDLRLLGDGLVAKLARAAYDERSLPAGLLEGDRLLVLADMLEERGITDAELLSHFRSAGPHWRGCWSLDLVLGRS